MYPAPDRAWPPRPVSGIGQRFGKFQPAAPPRPGFASDFPVLPMNMFPACPYFHRAWNNTCAALTDIVPDTSCSVPHSSGSAPAASADIVSPRRPSASRVTALHRLPPPDRCFPKNLVYQYSLNAPSRRHPVHIPSHLSNSKNLAELSFLVPPQTSLSFLASTLLPALSPQPPPGSAVPAALAFRPDPAPASRADASVPLPPQRPSPA